MKIAKLFLLLLIPVALLFMSCENELPEEAFLIEEIPDTANQSFTLSDVDYFELSLYKKDPAEERGRGERLFNQHLDIGEILRLEGLEPGYYSLIGWAYKINDNFDPENYNPEGGSPFDAHIYQVGTVEGKSDEMVTISGSNYMIIDESNPVIVKLVFMGDPNIY